MLLLVGLGSFIAGVIIGGAVMSCMASGKVDDIINYRDELDIRQVKRDASKDIDDKKDEIKLIAVDEAMALGLKRKNDAVDAAIDELNKLIELYADEGRITIGEGHPTILPYIKKLKPGLEALGYVINYYPRGFYEIIWESPCNSIVQEIKQDLEDWKDF